MAVREHIYTTEKDSIAQRTKKKTPKAWLPFPRQSLWRGGQSLVFEEPLGINKINGARCLVVVVMLLLVLQRGHRIPTCEQVLHINPVIEQPHHICRRHIQLRVERWRMLHKQRLVRTITSAGGRSKVRRRESPL